MTGDADAAGVAFDAAGAVVRAEPSAVVAGLLVLGTGWIETYRPSQTIGIGAYFQGVK